MKNETELMSALDALFESGLTFSACVHYFAQKRTPEEKLLRDVAYDAFHVDGEIEIDEDAYVSMPDDEDNDTDGGGYVMAWMWVD